MFAYWAAALPLSRAAWCCPGQPGTVHQWEEALCMLVHAACLPLQECKVQIASSCVLHLEKWSTWYSSAILIRAHIQWSVYNTHLCCLSPAILSASIQWSASFWTPGAPRAQLLWTMNAILWWEIIILLVCGRKKKKKYGLHLASLLQVSPHENYPQLVSVTQCALPFQLWVASGTSLHRWPW